MQPVAVGLSSFNIQLDAVFALCRAEECSKLLKENHSLHSPLSRTQLLPFLQIKKKIK